MFLSHDTSRVEICNQICAASSRKEVSANFNIYCETEQMNRIVFEYRLRLIDWFTHRAARRSVYIEHIPHLMPLSCAVSIDFIRTP